MEMDLTALRRDGYVKFRAASEEARTEQIAKSIGEISCLPGIEPMFSKAQLYSEAMEDSEEGGWKFGLLSAMTLEFLIRSAIASVSPALLADVSDWNNISYGLGIESKKSKFVPKSAPITELVSRLEELIPAFSRENANFCISQFARRNSEIHTGALPFEKIGSSAWLPNFYATCDVLTAVLGESLSSLFSSEIVTRAREDIEALQDDTAKSVRGAIHAYRMVWEDKGEEEKELAVNQAKTASLRHYGHRVDCPACSSVALVLGKAVGPVRQSIEEDGVCERQVMKPESLSCVACGLKVSGYSKLLAAGLGDTYTSTSHFDAVEYFGVDIDKHVRGLMEDDNNEY